jgi:arsenite methyltransferase
MTRSEEPEISYFGLQAYMGTTKHMGGIESTKELIELCHMDRDSLVLDVGCGAGATAVYLAKEIGCRVVAVDLRESMIALARERVRAEGVEDRVEFREVDARDLPFEDASFDTVLCESVATFIIERQQVADQLARVTRPGGYVGINEEIWLRPPPPELSDRARHLWEIESDLPTADDWQGMLENAGLQDLVVRAYAVDARRESSQVKRYRPEDMWRMVYRTAALYVKSPEFRAYMHDRRRIPKNMFHYLGYGLFAGRKNGHVAR